MKKRDARSLDHATLEEMRRLAVSRCLQGETQASVAASLQVCRTTVAKWMSAYKRGGAKAIASTKATGRAPKLTARQQAWLKRAIVGKSPQQYKFPFALWTVQVVAALIKRKFGVELHQTTVSRMLGRLGLTPQIPARRAFKRDEEACLHWATAEFPAIVRASKRRQSTLLFEDEAGVHENGPLATTWGARGQRPVVKATGTRRRINVISAISPRGRLWFRCYKGTLNAPRFIEFLQALLEDVHGKIDLVLDKHPAHVAASVRHFIESTGGRLRVHFLPPYAPDMNPDEHVWGHLKGLFRRKPVLDGENFDHAVDDSMNWIAADEALVRSFFEHPETTYVRAFTPAERCYDLVVCYGLYHCLGDSEVLSVHERALRSLRSGGSFAVAMLTNELPLPPDHGTSELFLRPSSFLRRIVNHKDWRVVHELDGEIEEHHLPVVGLHRHSVAWGLYEGWRWSS